MINFSFFFNNVNKNYLSGQKSEKCNISITIYRLLTCRNRQICLGQPNTWIDVKYKSLVVNQSSLNHELETTVTSTFLSNIDILIYYRYNNLPHR